MTIKLCLLGPTASGKTALAADLARARPQSELVSIDAIAVYRGLDIGSAKPSASERDGLCWHLIDLVDPSEVFSVAQFQQLARAAIASVIERGHSPVLVGGTGLYHRAVIDDLSIPPRYASVAAELEREAEAPGGLASLFARLRLLDPLAASRMEASNRRRIVRALEVSLGAGRPFSSFGPGLHSYPATDVQLVGIELSRAELDRRITERLDAQLQAGFLEEVAGLVSRSAPLSRTAAQALGYRELIEHLQGTLSLEEARQQILTRTRRFARRQQAWFRRDPRVLWLDGTRPDLLGALLECFDLEVEQILRRDTMTR